jgi:hypothetical protein
MGAIESRYSEGLRGFILNLNPYKGKSLFFLNGEYYSLTRDLLIGDPFRADLHGTEGTCGNS